MAKNSLLLTGPSGLSRALKVKETKPKQSKQSNRSAGAPTFCKPRRSKKNETAFHVFDEEDTPNATDVTEEEQRSTRPMTKTETDAIGLTMDEQQSIVKAKTDAIGLTINEQQSIVKTETDAIDLPTDEDWVDNSISSGEDDSKATKAKKNNFNKPWTSDEIDVIDRAVSSMTTIEPAYDVAMEVEELLRKGTNTPRHRGRKVMGIVKKLGECGFGEYKLAAKGDVNLFKQKLRVGIGKWKKEAQRQDKTKAANTIKWTPDEYHVVDQYISQQLEQLKGITDAARDVAELLKKRYKQPDYTPRTVPAIMYKFKSFKYKPVTGKRLCLGCEREWYPIRVRSEGGGQEASSSDR